MRKSIAKFPAVFIRLFSNCKYIGTYSLDHSSVQILVTMLELLSLEEATLYLTVAPAPTLQNKTTLWPQLYVCSSGSGKKFYKSSKFFSPSLGINCDQKLNLRQNRPFLTYSESSGPSPS